MKIITDRAADLSAQDIQAHDITVAPLYIQFPDGEIDSADITPDDFYDKLEAMFPDIPSTAQPSAGTFAELYRRIAATDPDIMAVHISSGLSGTGQSSVLGAGQVPEATVTHVDTLTLSGGERFQVLAAAMAAQAGWSKEKILERLDKIREATEVMYTLDTLTYLQRGGRIGRVQAIAGALFKIKPIIHVAADGKYSTLGRARTLQRARQAIVDALSEKYGHQTPLWVTILHGRFAEQAEKLTEAVQTTFNVARQEVMRISPVLGVHTGPGIVGVAVVPFALFDDLL